ncbi:MAG: quercetin 2,3-dioxygenase [Verrucomicrobiota bacterium]|jgi:redox-sensitive bicupin YhaK (pirin superfamily)
MKTIRRSEERGQADHGWLKARHTFSFAGYHDPKHMGFRSLRVINDDTVAGGGGFDTHPHRDMEIITYILSGSLQHQDSMGNGRVIRPGEFQYMAAGTGVLHSEFNPSPGEPVHLLQIWIVPDRKGAEPRYAEKPLTDAATGRLHLVASQSGRDGSIAINQDADLYLAKLNQGETLSHELKPGRHAWVQVAEGEIRLDGDTLRAGDAAALSNESSVQLEGVHGAQVLLFDLN